MLRLVPRDEDSARLEFQLRDEDQRRRSRQASALIVVVCLGAGGLAALFDLLARGMQ